MALGSFLFLKEQIKDIIIRDLADEIAVDIFPGDDRAIFFRGWRRSSTLPRLGCDSRRSRQFGNFLFFLASDIEGRWHFCAR
jgi:hypothetical protein